MFIIGTSFFGQMLGNTVFDNNISLGDTVIVLVLDNTNYSNKMILCKRPTNII